jgi:mono/diheme cytochrome c family protein
MRWILWLCVPALFACNKTPDIESGAAPKAQFLAFDGADAANGKSIYDTQCARCHGETGKGDGASGVNFDVAPTNFTSWQMPDDEKIFAWIRDGGAAMGGSLLMPAYSRTLRAQDIRDVGAYLKSFSAK